MLLTGFNIGHYLMDRGYVSDQNLVEGKFTVRLNSSRNFNFIVNKELEEAFFVKQVKTFSEEKTGTLKKEATIYWLAFNEPEFEPLQSFLPKYHEYDYFNHVLVLGYMPDAMDLDVFFYKHQQFPTQVMEQQAKVLNAYHKDVFKAMQNKRSQELFEKGLPMVFWMAENGYQQYSNGNSAAQQAVQLISQNEEYLSLIKQVKNTWEASSLIHGDVKNANFLINKNALESGSFQLRLVDWEIADIGDPCWDVGAVFQSYLLLWIMSETQNKANQGNPNQASFHFTLENMQPGIQTFWRHYASLMGFSKEVEREKLVKSMNYCALRLIQTCFESTQISEQLPPQSARMLQLSLNILKSPESAVQELFNL